MASGARQLQIPRQQAAFYQEYATQQSAIRLLQKNKRGKFSRGKGGVLPIPHRLLPVQSHLHVLLSWHPSLLWRLRYAWIHPGQISMVISKFTQCGRSHVWLTCDGKMFRCMVTNLFIDECYLHCRAIVVIVPMRVPIFMCHSAPSLQSGWRTYRTL